MVDHETYLKPTVTKTPYAYYQHATVWLSGSKIYPAGTPKELVGWKYWQYGGKGPRWPCWECRRYYRELFSEMGAAIPADVSYGVGKLDKGNNTTQWQTFAYKWYCMDCLKKIGVLW